MLPGFGSELTRTGLLHPAGGKYPSGGGRPEYFLSIMGRTNTTQFLAPPPLRGTGLRKQTRPARGGGGDLCRIFVGSPHGSPAHIPPPVGGPLTGTPLRAESGPKENSIP